MYNKETINRIIIEVARILNMEADTCTRDYSEYNKDAKSLSEGWNAIYISERLDEVFRGITYEGTVKLGSINGLDIIMDKRIGNSIREEFIRILKRFNYDIYKFTSIDGSLEEETPKEKKMEIVKTIKITFNDGNKIEWKNIRKYNDDKGKLFVAIDDTKEIQGSSRLELQVWYDFKDIKTYTITNKVVEVKGEDNE